METTVQSNKRQTERTSTRQSSVNYQIKFGCELAPKYFNKYPVKTYIFNFKNI